MATKAVRLTISGFLKGQFVQNVMHFLYTVSTTETDFQSALKCAEAFVAEVADTWFDSVPVDYIGSSIRSQVFPTTLHNNSGPTITQQDGFNTVPGTRSGTLAVTSIGPILVFPFEVAGHPRTGKVFLPGVTETDVNNNSLTSGLQTQLATLIGLLVNDISTGGADTMRYYVYSPTENEIYAPEGGYISVQVGSIRARQRPHG